MIAKIVMLILCGILQANPMPAYVAELNWEEDTILFVDFQTENEWLWDGTDGWHMDEDACLFMNDNGAIVHVMKGEC